MINKILDWYHDTKYAIKNLYRFHKIIKNHRDWDMGYVLNMFRFQLNLIKDNITNGNEVEEDKKLKLIDIKRCIELLDNIDKDEYIERCGGLNSSKYPFELEQIEGSENFRLKHFTSQQEDEEDMKTIEKANNLENLEWNELWDIIKSGKFGPDARSWWS